LFSGPFLIQNKDVEVMNEVAKDLRAAVLETIPAHERLAGLSAEERLEGLSAQQIVRLIPPEEIATALTEQQIVRLRELLERRKPSGDRSSPSGEVQ
jgi:predicted HAD superfamily phosphohydrolase